MGCRFCGLSGQCKQPTQAHPSVLPRRVRPRLQQLPYNPLVAALGSQPEGRGAVLQGNEKVLLCRASTASSKTASSNNDFTAKASL